MVPSGGSGCGGAAVGNDPGVIRWGVPPHRELAITAPAPCGWQVSVGRLKPPVHRRMSCPLWWPTNPPSVPRPALALTPGAPGRPCEGPAEAALKSKRWNRPRGGGDAGGSPEADPLGARRELPIAYATSPGPSRTHRCSWRFLINLRCAAGRHHGTEFLDDLHSWLTGSLPTGSLSDAQIAQVDAQRDPASVHTTVDGRGSRWVVSR